MFETLDAVLLVTAIELCPPDQPASDPERLDNVRLFVNEKGVWVLRAWLNYPLAKSP